MAQVEKSGASHSAQVILHPSAIAASYRSARHAMAGSSRSLSESAEALRTLAADADGSASRIRDVQGELDGWMGFAREFQDQCFEAMELESVEEMVRRRDALISSLATRPGRAFLK